MSFFIKKKKWKSAYLLLGAAKTGSGYNTSCNSFLFYDDWRMRQMDCVNEPTGKQLLALRPLEI